MRQKTSVVLNKFAAIKGISKKRVKREWHKTPRNIRSLLEVKKVTAEIEHKIKKGQIIGTKYE